MSLLTSGQVSEAVTSLRAWTQANADSFEGFNYLGVALSQSGRHDEAVTVLQRAVGLNPQSAVARYNLGVALEKLGNPDAARKEFQTAVQLDDKHTGAKLALSRVNSAVGVTPSSSQAANPTTSGSSTYTAAPHLSPDQLAERERLDKPNIVNVFTGLAVGIIAAIVCAVIWDKLTYYTGYQIGYVAIGVGFVVGTAVVMGAGGKRGLSLQIIAAMLSLFGILLGETLLNMDGLRDYLATNPTPKAANLSSAEMFLYSLMYLPESFKESPMSALFALMGLWCGWSAPAKQKEEEVFPEATATDAAPAAASAMPTLIVDAPPTTATSVGAAASETVDAPPRAL